MRTVLAVALVVAMLFTAGLAYSATVEPVSPQGAITDMQGLSCPNPEKVTVVTESNLFAGPKLGFIKVPVERETIRCRVGQ